MDINEIDEFVDRLIELMEAIVDDSKNCSCCSTPQTWDARAKLAEFLVKMEKFS